MWQRLHPEASWAKPYRWCDVPVDDLRPLGPPVDCTLVPGGWRLGWPGGWACQVRAVAPGIVRLAWTHVQVTAIPPSGAVVLDDEAMDVATTVDATSITTAGWRLAQETGGGLTWGPVDGPCALDWRSLALAPADRGLRLMADFALAPGEALHGCGGRTGPLDRRGHTCDFFAVKVDGPENGDYGGLPMPYVMGSRGAGLFFDNPWPHVHADFGYGQPDRMGWYVPGGPAICYLLAGPSPTVLQRRWHLLTGAPVLPPRWYFGLWLSLCARTTAADWHGWISRCRAEDWPLDVVVLDLEWRGGELTLRNEGGDGTGLDWHPTFGDGPALVRHAQEQGVRICLHCNTRQFGPAIAQRGLAEGWLRRVDEQVVVDPSTPAKVAAIWALHAPRVSEGIACWWTDNGERVDGELGEGLPSRNLFGARWNEFLFQGMAAAGRPNRLVLTRGDWVGAQRHALPWPGDTCPGVDRLDEDLRFILNCAVSGVPFAGTDLGAFRHGKDDGEDMGGRMLSRENLVRRVIHAFLYQPIARIHNSRLHKFPWTLPPALQRLWRLYLGLRYRLLPWWWNAATRAASAGVPLVRPLWFDFPDEPALHGVDDQLLIGDGLLAAPVVRDAAWDRRVRLPAGQWYHFWSGMIFIGGREHLVDASADAIDGLPLFVRAGTVLVYGPPADRCPEETGAEFWLDAYPGRNAHGELRDTLEGPPLLAWSFTGDGLELSGGSRPLRLHLGLGTAGGILELPAHGRTCVPLTPWTARQPSVLVALEAGPGVPP